MTDDPGLPEALGARLRAARESAGLSMRALARASGVSQPFLSLVERGMSTPSLATLYRIAGPLGVAPSQLMPAAGATGDEPGVGYVPAGSARRLPVSDGARAAVGVVLSTDPALEVVEYRAEPGQDLGDWFTSAGVQTLTVLAGRVVVEIEGRGSWTLAAGDALTHPSHVPHRWRLPAGEGAHLLLAVAHDLEERAAR